MQELHEVDMKADELLKDTKRHDNQMQHMRCRLFSIIPLMNGIIVEILNKVGRLGNSTASILVSLIWISSLCMKLVIDIFDF